MSAGHPFDAPLAAWIEAEAGLKGARVSRALSGGNANLTLLLATDDGPLVLRTPPENAISATSHRGIEREATVLRAIQGHVKAPRVVGWCEDAAVIGRPFLLVSHVDGIAITDTLPATYPATAASVNRLGEDLIDELAAIHRAPWQTIGLERLGNPQNFLERQITRWRAARAESPVRDLPLLDELAVWLLNNIPESGPVGLIHGDYHLDNTLSHPDRPGLAAVIDWELATIGDPLADLGLFLMFWGPRELDPPGFRHIQAVSRCENALSRRVLAERWGAATGFPLTNLDFYLCFAFWRLAAIVEGAYSLYFQGKVDSDYAKGLEYDVPALLEEAAAAARGHW